MREHTTLTPCNTLQHTSAHCNKLQSSHVVSTLSGTGAHLMCNTFNCIYKHHILSHEQYIYTIDHTTNAYTRAPYIIIPMIYGMRWATRTTRTRPTLHCS